jgi:hypothetical protein
MYENLNMPYSYLASASLTDTRALKFPPSKVFGKFDYTPEFIWPSETLFTEREVGLVAKSRNIMFDNLTQQVNANLPLAERWENHEINLPKGSTFKPMTLISTASSNNTDLDIMRMLVKNIYPNELAGDVCVTSKPAVDSGTGE